MIAPEHAGIISRCNLWANMSRLGVDPGTARDRGLVGLPAVDRPS